MSTVARNVASVPQRSSGNTWSEIVRLLAPDPASDSHKELIQVAGIASSLIARGAMESAPVVVHGGPGPRVRIYCVYGPDAIAGDGVNEAALATIPTLGNWKVSLPCPAEDLTWVTDALKINSTRITARDMKTSVDNESSEFDGMKATDEQTVNLEAFLKR